MIDNGTKEPSKEQSAYETKDKRQYLNDAMKVGFYFYANEQDEAKKPRYIKGIQEHGYKSATNNSELIDPLFEPNQKGQLNYNVGMNLEASGLFCLDFDNHGDSTAGSSLLAELFNQFKGLNDTVIEKTPHGYHLYYKDDLTEQERKIIGSNHSINNLAGLEIKRSNANVWPSKGYSQLGNKRLSKNEVRTLPNAFHKYLNELLTGKRKAVLNTKPSEVDTKASDFKSYRKSYVDKAYSQLNEDFDIGRHTALNSFAGKLQYAGYEVSEIIEMISDYLQSDSTGKEPIEGNEIVQLASYPDKKASANGKEQRTIYDNFKERKLIAKSMFELDRRPTKDSQVIKARKMAKLWIEEHPDENNKKLKQLPYQVAAEIMLQCFDIVRFSEDENSRVSIYVNDPRSSKHGLYVQNYDYLAKKINEFRSSYSIKQINEVIKKIEFGTYGIAKPYADRNRIPVGNGIYNVDTKALENFTPKTIFRSKVETNFNDKYRDESLAPNINGWTLDGWLNELCKDEDGNVDKEVLTLLWQIIADAVNGNYSRNQAMFLYSEDGGSGKGSFITLVESIVGASNYASANLEAIEQRFTMASLVNKSLCVGDENSGVVSKKTPNFKSLVTGDTVTVEGKNANAYAARLKMLVLQCFNTLPTVPVEGGYWRRITYVPFRQKFYDPNDRSKEDTNVKDKLLLNKDVNEYALYKALTVYSDFSRFIEPKVSRNLKENAQLINDNVRAFIFEEFDYWNVPIISKAALYVGYKRYCELNGFKPLSQLKFSNRAKRILKNEDRPHAYVDTRTRINKSEYNKLLEIEQDHSSFMYGTHEMNKPGKMNQCFKRV